MPESLRRAIERVVQLRAAILDLADLAQLFDLPAAGPGFTIRDARFFVRAARGGEWALDAAVAELRSFCRPTAL